jgi:cation:H+ antiporter
MWMELLAIAAGFALLTWSADRFVAGASAIAYNLNISPLIIGLTIVSLGTSAPEILVSAVASLQGNGSLAIGNALGSNIINIALVLGVTALIVPLNIRTARRSDIAGRHGADARLDDTSRGKGKIIP